MKTAYLVTGIVGSGKSCVYDELTRCGYNAYELDDLEDIVIKLPEPNTKSIKSSRHAIRSQYNWAYDLQKILELLDKQKESIAFYCGVAGNINDAVGFFAKTILLSASNEVIRHRLDGRISENNISDESHEWTLAWKDSWEEYLISAGAISISSDNNIDIVVNQIIDSVK